jgi:hypothetical protein
MFHSLRHRASTTNRPIGGIDDECSSPSGKPSKQQRWKSKPCPVRGGAGGPRNPREEEDSMILPRSIWPTNCCQCCLVGTVATILFLLLFLQSAYMMGDGYSSNGGVVGEYVDRWIMARYEQETAQRQRAGIVFPNVQVKATWRMEQAHYSTYLEQILRLHQGRPNTASNTSVEPLFALLPRPQRDIEMVRPVSNERRRNDPNAADIVTVTGATASFAVAKAGDLIGDLRKEQCHSNWLCQRCLNAPFRGTYEACAALCRQCYIRILSTIPGRKDEPIQISGVQTNTDQIPKIIHQAWHFYPSSSEYPELSRLMARWRNSEGYEYNFYTGYHEQDVFVNEHYPPIVGKALNAIPTRLSRLAFFRLLVLYKMGGVFADGTHVSLFFLHVRPVFLTVFHDSKLDVGDQSGCHHPEPHDLCHGSESRSARQLLVGWFHRRGSWPPRHCPVH